MQINWPYKFSLIGCFALICLSLGSITSATSIVLNIYSWAGHLPDTVVKQFEEITNIRVNITYYANNEMLYAKLKTDPSAKYDLILPSNYLLPKLMQQNMLQKLDVNKLRHWDAAHANKLVNHDYALPLLWSSTGIIVNTKYHNFGNSLSWQELWKQTYNNQLLLLDDAREVFSMALFTLGYSPNTTNAEELQAALHKLQALLPNVKLFNSEALPAIYIDEDITIGMIWSGEAYLAQKANPALKFYYPTEGFVTAIDCIAIPQGAPHVDAAYQFIDFVLRADVAAEIARQTGFATPNLAVKQQLPAELRHHPIMFPTPALLTRQQLQLDIGKHINLLEEYFALLKMT
jgi:spermidine/putrescine transport system substrate-binding protein